MKHLKLILAVVLSIGLVVGLAFPVLAKSDKAPTPPGKDKLQPFEVLSGNVTGIDPGKTFFFLQQKGKPPIQITVNAGTQYFIQPVPRQIGEVLSNRPNMSQDAQKKLPNSPGKPQVVPGPMGGGAVAPVAGGQKATFDDLSIGDRVTVRVARGTTLAKQVIILKPVIGRVNGTITAISVTDNTTTIQPLNGGNPITVKWDKNTVVTIRGAIAVTVGQHAQVVYRLKNMVATTIRIIPPRPTPVPTSSKVTPGQRKA